MKVTHCRVCNAPDLKLVVDLGVTALANSFIDPKNPPAAGQEPRFPLRVVLCEHCGLVQIDEEVDPAVLFKNYIYVSGTSDLVFTHAAWLANHFATNYHLGATSLVVEAASNDGTVLKACKAKGVKVLGVEPAENIAARANADGIPTVCEFFNAKAAEAVRAKHGPAKLFMGRHVLAHVADLHGFVAGIKAILDHDGVGVVEMPYLLHFFNKLEYDTVYHEHLCYFGVRVLRTLFERFGLEVIDVSDVEIHGGSIVLSVQHKNGPHKIKPVVAEKIAHEEALGLHTLAAWRDFAAKVQQQKHDLLAELRTLKAAGKRIAGYGAPAKGNTLLAYCGIGPETLDFIADKSPYKQNMLTPGHHIPVLHPDRLLETQPDVLLILAWNFAPEIIRQQAEYARRGGKFLIPIPTPHYAPTTP